MLLSSSSSSSVSWTKPFSRHLDIWNVGHVVFKVAQTFDKGVHTVKFTSNLRDAILERVRISEHVLVELKAGTSGDSVVTFSYHRFDAMSRARGFFPVALASVFGVATGMSMRTPKHLICTKNLCSHCDIRSCLQRATEEEARRGTGAVRFIIHAYFHVIKLY